MTIRTASVRSLRVAGLAMAVTGFAVAAAAPSAGATMSCGQTNLGFEGTRLLNDGISNMAGPFSIDLPAGTYDVTMQSHDAHDEHPGQTDQTQEQWYFVLDSGYTSPVTVDVPDESNTSVTTVQTQEIGESASITLHHLGEGSINSVDPICVGFTPVTVEPQPQPVAPPTTVEVKAPSAPKEVVEPPKEVVEPPVTTTVPVQVAGVVAEPGVEQLALTGPTTTTWVLVTGGVAMMLGGAGLLHESRRRLV